MMNKDKIRKRHPWWYMLTLLWMYSFLIAYVMMFMVFVMLVYDASMDKIILLVIIMAHLYVNILHYTYFADTKYFRYFDRISDINSRITRYRRRKWIEHHIFRKNRDELI